MPALNYRAVFATAVERGSKRQTIRRVRKRPIRAGDKLYHYTGMRTARCRLLREDPCLCVLPIRITDREVAVDRRVLGHDERRLLAARDGFPSIDCFLAFFRGQYDPYWGTDILSSPKRR